MDEIRYCDVHGDTTFRYYPKTKIWRCLLCLSEHVLKCRENTKRKAVLYKGGLCQVCGYNKYVGALEFHHLNPKEKDFGIGAKGYTRSWKNLTKELDKCIMVCANCHREIHAGLISDKDIHDSINLLPPEEDKKSYCIDCGKPVEYRNTRCKDCYSKYIARNIPDKILLVNDFKLLKSFLALGRKYNVSDNTIRKWMKKYNLPTHTNELLNYVNTLE